MHSPQALLTSVLLVTYAVSGTAAEVATTPRIDQLESVDAQKVCQAWPRGIPASDTRSTGFVWVGYPASVRPFGMRGYMAIDGKTHPLKQVAYAFADGTMSIYYRTLGDYHYDIYLELSGFGANLTVGDNLTGSLVVSRFGNFAQIEISGKCGADE